MKKKSHDEESQACHLPILCCMKSSPVGNPSLKVGLMASNPGILSSTGTDFLKRGSQKKAYLVLSKQIPNLVFYKLPLPNPTIRCITLRCGSATSIILVLKKRCVIFSTDPIEQWYYTPWKIFLRSPYQLFAKISKGMLEDNLRYRVYTLDKHRPSSL